METIQLRVIDQRLVVSRLPDDVVELMREHKLFLAGGFIRAMLGEGKASDIDLFGPGGLDGMLPIAEAFQVARSGSLIRTERALTVLKSGMLPVQFIIGFPTDDPSALITRFDFTIAQVAIWYDGGQWQSVASPDFYADLAARRLVYSGTNAITDVGGSLLRMRKFLTAGYSIQVPSLARLVARMSLNVDEFAAAPIDEAKAARVIEGLLRELDPNVIPGQEVA
jgi:hypothetical protein